MRHKILMKVIPVILATLVLLFAGNTISRMIYFELTHLNPTQSFETEFDISISDYKVTVENYHFKGGHWFFFVWELKSKSAEDSKEILKRLNLKEFTNENYNFGGLGDFIGKGPAWWPDGIGISASGFIMLEKGYKAEKKSQPKTIAWMLSPNGEQIYIMRTNMDGG